MSVEFFGVNNLGQIGGIKNTQKTQTGKKAESTGDQVQFSSVLQDVNKAQASTDTSSTRESRVEELKAQIADGSYQPDLTKVASSLLQFLIEEK